MLSKRRISKKATECSQCTQVPFIFGWMHSGRTHLSVHRVTMSQLCLHKWMQAPLETLKFSRLEETSQVPKQMREISLISGQRKLSLCTTEKIVTDAEGMYKYQTKYSLSVSQENFQTSTGSIMQEAEALELLCDIGFNLV